MLGELKDAAMHEVRFETRRCVKCVCAPPPLGELTALPRSLAGFGQEKRAGEWKVLGMERERKGKKEDGKLRRGEDEWSLGAMRFKGMGRINGKGKKYKGNGRGKREKGKGEEGEGN